MADKIANFENFFAPLAQDTPLAFDTAAVDRLKRSKVNMAQEILLRFGLCYTVLQEELIKEGSVKTPLKERVSTIKNRYTEILQNGGNTLEQKLAKTSSLAGRSADDITNNYWAILKYLPMAAEEVFTLLVCSPQHLWQPILKASFETFHASLEQEILEGASQLFALTNERATTPQLEDVSKARKLLLSRGAFPSAAQKFTPFLMVFAEWLAYNPQEKLPALCKLLDISEPFLKQKVSTLTDKIRSYALPPDLNFCAFLASRSAKVFCQAMNLRLSERGLQKLVNLFARDEPLRRSWVFFSWSKELRDLQPSEKTAPLSYHPLICFSDFRKKILNQFDQNLSISLKYFLNQQVQELSSENAGLLLSSLFEWLLFANPQDQEIFFSNCKGYGVVRPLTTIQDLKTLNISNQEALKAFFLFITHYETLSNLSGHLDYCSYPPTRLVYEWILAGTEDEQDDFFSVSSIAPSKDSLESLTRVSLGTEQRLAVLTFVFRNQGDFTQTLEFIETLPLEDSAKDNLKKIFAHHICQNTHPIFLKIKEDFQRFVEDLFCKLHSRSVQEDETWIQFYKMCTPIFVWSVQATAQTRHFLHLIGCAFRLEPLTKSLQIMEAVNFPENKKLLLWLAILPNLNHVPDVVALIDSLNNERLKHSFFEALCKNQQDHFFSAYFVFLKFQDIIKDADYVFEWIVEAKEESFNSFSTMLNQIPPKDLTSFLSLMAPLDIPLKTKLETLLCFMDSGSFLIQTFSRLELLSPPDKKHDIQKAFLDRYVEERSYVKLHLPDEETQGNVTLHSYVLINLKALKDLAKEFYFPSQKALIDLCFNPLTQTQSLKFKQFFDRFETTAKTSTFYEALVSFIKGSITLNHIYAVENIFRELGLFTLPHDIFAIMNAIKSRPELNATIPQSQEIIAHLKNFIGKSLNPLQAVLLFFDLVNFGKDISNKKFQTLELLERTTAVFLNSEDIFDWIMKYPGDDDFSTHLRTLARYRHRLEEVREEPSLPTELHESISATVKSLHDYLDSYRLAEETATSLKRHIATALILPDLPNFFDFFPWEALDREKHINIPFDPRYPKGKRLTLAWKKPPQEGHFPTLIISGHASLWNPLCIPMQDLELHPQILNFTRALLEDCGKEEKTLTGDFTEDFNSFSDTVKAHWRAAELYKTEEAKKMAGERIYKFVLTFKIALRKRRFTVPREE